jgi:hypothetical protein
MPKSELKAEVVAHFQDGQRLHLELHCICHMLLNYSPISSKFETWYKKHLY